MRVSGNGGDATGTRPHQPAPRWITFCPAMIRQQSLLIPDANFFAYGTELLTVFLARSRPRRYGAAASRCHLVMDRGSHRRDWWSLAEYVFANQLGQLTWQIASRDFTTNDRARDSARDHALQWTGVFDLGSHARENWRIQAVFSSELRQRLTRLWTEREQLFLAVLNRFSPQIFSHSITNVTTVLRTRVDGTRETYAGLGICGVGAPGDWSHIGAARGNLIGSPRKLPQADEAARLPPIFRIVGNWLWSGDAHEGFALCVYRLVCKLHFSLIILACNGTAKRPFTVVTPVWPFTRGTWIKPAGAGMCACT